MTSLDISEDPKGVGEEGKGEEYTKHRGSSITAASEEAIKSLENKMAIPEEESDTDEAGGKEADKGANKGGGNGAAVTSADGTAESDGAQDLIGSGTKTQDQGAAEAGSVGMSVAD